jgi:hypothetical protein
VRQNGVRAIDWDEDGRTDLVVGDTDGFVWLFRNTTDALFPVFTPGERLMADGQPIKVYGEEPEGRLAGYARVDVADWDGDGRKDLIVADGRAWAWLYANQGTKGRPVLGRGRRIRANGRPIDGTSRGSVLVRDWDGDGRLDLVLGMVGEGPSANPDWPPRPGDPSRHRGFLYYRNLGTPKAPALGAPKWIKAGPEPTEIDLLRPNLGDFVDWDGDGKKDFLACEFENECRVWRRTDAGGPGVKPVFAGPPEGETILAPYSDQMISGLDARDWNGDGDVDLLTGQGHGGSGIRFYERDFLEDTRAGRLPEVTIDRQPDPVSPRPLSLLRLDPQGLHLFEGRAGRTAAGRAQALLDVAEAPSELPIRRLERALRVVPEPARHVDRGEHQVADLLGNARRVGGAVGQRPPQLRHLLLELGQDRLGVGPVEADARGLGRHLEGLHGRRLRGGHAGQHRVGVGRLALGPALRLLDGLPVAQHLAGGVGGLVGEDVRVPAHHLVGHPGDDVGDGEAPLPGGDLRMEDDLEKEVAQLARQLGVVPFVDGLEDLVGLLDGHGLEALVGLLAVPRAASGRAQPGDQPDEPCEVGTGIGFVGHGGHCTSGPRT